jgi:predicted porin
MKKSLLALAALGCFSSVAFGQTNVTIYGIVDTGITYENNGGTAGHVFRMDSGLMNGSRLGFKGSEDLGGGLSAIFTLENGFSNDTGALGQGGALFGRQSWVGLSGAFGSVKVGVQNTVVYANNSTFDPFGNGLAGDASRVFNFVGSRLGNMITYNYTATNGLRGELQYAFGEVAGNQSANRTVAGYGGYRNGPVDVILAYNKTTDALGVDSAKTTLLGGNYDFGFIKPYLAYAINKGVGTLDTRDALVGFRLPVGVADTIIASWLLKNDRQKDNANTNQLGLGYQHDFSQRTAFYASISRTGNSSQANYHTGVGAPLGASDNLADIGIRHRF